MTGYFKASETVKRDIKAIKGESTTLTGYQKQELDPDDTVDKIWRAIAGQSIYAAIRGKDYQKLAPVSQSVLNDYERTQDKDFLPPVTTATLQKDGWQLIFSPEMKKEYIDLVNQAILAKTEDMVESPERKKFYDEYKDERKKKKLAEWYAAAKEDAKELYIKKYDKDRHPELWKEAKK